MRTKSQLSSSSSFPSRHNLDVRTFVNKGQVLLYSKGFPESVFFILLISISIPSPTPSSPIIVIKGREEGLGRNF